MKKIIFILFMLSTIVFVGQTNDALFEQANAKYKEGQYQEALDLYTKITESKKVSADLYYNMANCYYKLNSVANTIYYYEKALLLNPSHSDANNNLQFAKRMTIDRIEELPKTFFQKMEVKYIQKLSFNQWAILAVIFSFLGATLFILFYTSVISNKKRMYFLTSILSFIFLFLSVFTAYHLYEKSTHQKPAIIFGAKTTVKNAPTNNADEIFMLHEGVKVNIIDSVDNWKKIKLADGKIGWIAANELKELYN